jgi:hypothetical protein
MPFSLRDEVGGWQPGEFPCGAHPSGLLLHESDSRSSRRAERTTIRIDGHPLVHRWAMVEIPSDTGSTPAVFHS